MENNQIQPNSSNNSPVQHPANTQSTGNSAIQQSESKAELASKIYPSSGDKNFTISPADDFSEDGSDGRMSEKNFNRLLFVLFIVFMFIGPPLFGIILSLPSFINTAMYMGGNLK